jgi:hypothetical protein
VRAIAGNCRLPGKHRGVAVGTRVTSRPPHRSVRAGFPAYGSHLGYQRQRYAVCEPTAVTRLCGSVSGACFVGPHSPWSPALGSTDSAADRSALFVGFPATMAESDFSRPCIIGYGSSPSRCGPPTRTTDGQTRDIPSSNAILLRVMWPTMGMDEVAALTASADKVVSVKMTATLRLTRSAARAGNRLAEAHDSRRSCTVSTRARG